MRDPGFLIWLFLLIGTWLFPPKRKSYIKYENLANESTTPIPDGVEIIAYKIDTIGRYNWIVPAPNLPYKGDRCVAQQSFYVSKEFLENQDNWSQ